MTELTREEIRQRADAEYRDMLRRAEAEERSMARIVETERSIRRDNWIITIISFLLCFPLAWLLAKVMP